MKFKVLKDFTHNGVLFVKDEKGDSKELHDGAIDGLLSAKFVEEVKKTKKIN